MTTRTGPAACEGPDDTSLIRNPGKETDMLYYAAVFFVIAIVAAVLGFGGIAAGAASIAKILFVVFLIGAIAAVLLGLFRRA